MPVAVRVKREDDRSGGEAGGLQTSTGGWRTSGSRRSSGGSPGGPRPWTDDPILARFKFCNTFRAVDRVSQYMITEVACGPPDGDHADLMMRIVAFRTFSCIATWEGLRRELGGEPRVAHLASSRLRACAGRRGGRAMAGLYTAAFILCANKAFGFDEKHRNHAALFRRMFVEERLDRDIAGANSLGRVVAALRSYPLMGPFMAYQTAVDLNYFRRAAVRRGRPRAGRTRRAARDWAKAFTDLGGSTPEEAIMGMVDRQEAEFERLGLPFRGLFGRRLHAIDCQGPVLRTRQVLPRGRAGTGERPKQDQGQVRAVARAAHVEVPRTVEARAHGCGDARMEPAARAATRAVRVAVDGAGTAPALRPGAEGVSAPRAVGRA